MNEYNDFPIIQFGEPGGLENIILFQGAMGVGVSRRKLVSAVVKQGGIGTIAAVGLGVLDNSFNEKLVKIMDELRKMPAKDKDERIKTLYSKTSCEALAREIQGTKELIGNNSANGFFGVNILWAITEKIALIKTAIQQGAGFVVCGAGIPKNLPQLILEYGTKKTKAIPMVSGEGYAGLICKLWEQRYGYYPDAIIVEGPMAGGHLGYKRKELEDSDFVLHDLERTIPKVVEVVKPFEQRAGRRIPVIAAGGIFYGGDIKKYGRLGAAGIQMATRFITTHECDAADEFKRALIDSNNPEDLVIIDSPVKMPGRAVNNQFLRDVYNGKKHPLKCIYRCLETCNKPEDQANPPPYCIARALVSAVKGDLKKGFAFTGYNGFRCKEKISVAELIDKLKDEYNRGICCD